MGNFLALASDARCLEHLRFVIDRESIHAEFACRALLNFAERTGKPDLARECKEKLGVLKEKTADAWVQRGRLATEDEFHAHGLAPAEIAAIARMLADAPRLRRAFVCRKKVQDFSSSPHFVVLFEWERFSRTLGRQPLSDWLDRFSAKMTFEYGSGVVAETNAAGPGASASSR